MLHWNGENAVPAGRRPPYTLVLMTSKTGYVMAHELGHLMLPGGRHAVPGIMRGSFPLTSRSADTFAAVETRLICVRLDQEASD